MAWSKAVDEEPEQKSRSFLKERLRRRSVWGLAAALRVALGATSYHLWFAKAKDQYVTATVERRNLESTVVAASIREPPRPQGRPARPHRGAGAGLRGTRRRDRSERGPTC